MRLLVLVAMLTDVASSLKCFSCASADYEPLFEKSAALRHSLSSPRFGDLCDSVEQLLAVAPVETCPSTCISLLEPQYFGGVQSYSTPYTYIRGCASTVFASIKERPREIDFLHTEAICLPLRLSQIWPSIHTDEHVQVCSCTVDGCNTKVSMTSASQPTYASSTMLFLVAVAITASCIVHGQTTK